MSRDLVSLLTEAGLFRLCVPRSLGGTEAHVATTIEAIEEVARNDGSTGWCVMIGATTGVIGAYLADDVAREVFAREDTILGGVYAPRGTAAVEDGGFRVSGRWPFASGSQHCIWLLGGCVVTDGGAPRLLPGGGPDPHMMLFPAADVGIVDTWDVAGLRGTGSHDIVVTDTLVPTSHAVSLVTTPPRARGPLFRFPVFGLLALGIAGVALGIARRAVEELVALASDKRPTGSRRTLAERALVQSQVAQAEALLGSARAFLFGTIADVWDAASRGEIGLADRARLRLAATHATASAAQATDLMYGAGGGTSIYATSALQRCFRDVHTATQHVMVAPPTTELVGRVLLGVDADTSML